MAFLTFKNQFIEKLELQSDTLKYKYVQGTNIQGDPLKIFRLTSNRIFNSQMSLSFDSLNHISCKVIKNPLINVQKRIFQNIVSFNKMLFSLTFI